MRKIWEIQQDIMRLMQELFQAQEVEMEKMRDELTYTRASISQLDQKNRRIAEILMEG